jgi:hypothetical protein
MAKLNRAQRAQQRLDAAWGHESELTPCNYKLVPYDRLFNGLLLVCKRYGIRVWLMSAADREQERTYRDRSGTYRAAGIFRAPATIKLASKSVRVLAHELAHALDYQLGQGYRGSEVIATAVETLVCGATMRSYSTNVDYAQRQWGTKLEYAMQQDRIQVIYETIMECLSA